MHLNKGQYVCIYAILLIYLVNTAMVKVFTILSIVHAVIISSIMMRIDAYV